LQVLTIKVDYVLVPVLQGRFHLVADGYSSRCPVSVHAFHDSFPAL